MSHSSKFFENLEDFTCVKIFKSGFNWKIDFNKSLYFPYKEKVLQHPKITCLTFLSNTNSKEEMLIFTFLQSS